MKFLGKNSLPPPTADEGCCCATAAPLTTTRITTVSTRFMQAPGKFRLIAVLGKRTDLVQMEPSSCRPVPIGRARHYIASLFGKPLRRLGIALVAGVYGPCKRFANFRYRPVLLQQMLDYDGKRYHWYQWKLPTK